MKKTIPIHGQNMNLKTFHSIGKALEKNENLKYLRYYMNTLMKLKKNTNHAGV